MAAFELVTDVSHVWWGGVEKEEEKMMSIMIKIKIKIKLIIQSSFFGRRKRVKEDSTHCADYKTNDFFFSFFFFIIHFPSLFPSFFFLFTFRFLLLVQQ